MKGPQLFIFSFFELSPITSLQNAVQDSAAILKAKIAFMVLKFK